MFCMVSDTQKTLKSISCTQAVVSKYSPIKRTRVFQGKVGQGWREVWRGGGNDSKAKAGKIQDKPGIFREIKK